MKYFALLFSLLYSIGVFAQERITLYKNSEVSSLISFTIYSPDDTISIYLRDGIKEKYRLNNYDSDTEKYYEELTIDIYQEPIQIIGDIYRLDIEGEELSILKTSDCPSLKKLNCNNNNLSSLDLSKNTELSLLNCSNNSIDSINLSNCELLTSLDCSYNTLKNLNIKNNIFLKTVICNNNILDTIFFGEKKELQKIDCGYNNLKYLDLTNINQDIEFLYCNNNKLQELDISHLSNLNASNLIIKDNNLTISSLNTQDGLNLNEQAQAPIVLKKNWFVKNEIIDLSKYSNKKNNNENEQNTEFTWYLKNNTNILQESIDYIVILPGVFKFITCCDDSIYCTMKNPVLNNFKVQTENIKIEDKEYDNKSVLLETTVGTEISIGTQSSKENDTIRIDWGNGEIEKYSIKNDSITPISGKAKGEGKVIVYSNYISFLDVSNNGLTKLNIANCPDLIYLNCSGNNFTSVDFKKNKNLKKLICSNSNIEYISLSDNSLLEYIDISDNPLSIDTLSFEYNPNIKFLYSEKTGINSINIASNDSLENLYISNNNIDTLIIAKNRRLKTLDCSANKLTFIDLSTNDSLLEIDISNNKIDTLIDFSHNTKLNKIDVSFNEFDTINISNNTDLDTLICTNTNIQYLETSSNEKLRYLNVNTNTLKKLDLSNNKKLSELHCINNYLSLRSLLMPDMLTDYTITPQRPYQLNKNSFYTYEDIDLSRLFNVTDTDNNPITQDIAWCTVNDDTLELGTDFTNNNGTFTFNKEQDSIYCKIQYHAFNDFILETQIISIADIVNKEPTLQFYSSREDTILRISIETAITNVPFAIKYGRDSIKQYKLTNKKLFPFIPTNDTISIFCDEITYLNISELGITYLNVENANKLKDLYCTKNKLLFSTLPVNQYSNYFYSPQDMVKLTVLKSANTIPELEAERLILDNKGDTITSQYSFTSEDKVIYTADDYVNLLKQLDKSNKYTCTIKNKALPSLSLVFVIEFIDDIEQKLTNPAISLIKNSEGTTTLGFKASTDNSEITIDWGNDSTEIYTLGTNDTSFSHTAGNTIKIYGNNVTKFDCSGQGITELNVDSCTTLEILECNINNLSNLHISSNKNLKKLSCYSNQISSLDLSKNSKLEQLHFGYNLIKNIDLSENKQLQYFNCQNNTITKLILNNNKLISTLNCSNNKLTELNIDSLTMLTSQDCSNNKLTFTTLPICDTTICTYIYSPQDTVIQLQETYSKNDTLDLRNALQYRQDSKTSLTFLTNNKDIITNEYYSVTNDTIIFLQSTKDTILGEFTNQLFPYLTLKTTAFTIKAEVTEPDPEPAPQLSIQLVRDLKQDASFKISSRNENETITIDWGNDSIKTYTIGKKETAITHSSGNTIKIYGDSISAFYCSGQGITELNIDSCTTLDSLDCSNNQLQELNVVSNPDLQKLNCKNNQLRISTISIVDTLESSFILTPQALYNLPESIWVDDTLNLQSEAFITLKDTSVHSKFVWHTQKDSVVKEANYTQKDGTFIFHEPLDSIYCTITNPAIPNLNLNTSYINIKALAELKHSAYFTSQATDSISFTIKTPDSLEVIIDWGNKNIKNYICDTTVTIKGKPEPNDTVKIFCNKVSHLDLQNCQITSLEILDSTLALNCAKNKLTFATLPIRDTACEYIYSPQDSIYLLKKTFTENEEIFLQKELHNRQDSKTTLFFITANKDTLQEGTHYSNTDGIIQFLTAVDSIITGHIKNPLFPNLTIHTSTFKVLEKETEPDPEPIISSILLVRESAGEIILKLSSLNGVEQITIDWGNGIIDNENITSSINGTSVKGKTTDTVKIFGEKISSIYVNNQNLIYLNVSNCTTLEKLYCEDNKLKDLNIKNNSKLEELHCSNNNLTIKTLPKQNDQIFYIYNDQKILNLNIQNIVPKNDTIDLSAQLHKADSTTRYRWFTVNNEPIPDSCYTEFEGKFIFLTEFTDPIYCTMVNPALPELELVTSSISVCGAIPSFILNSGCSPLEIDSIPNNSENASSYKWFFPNDVSSSDRNPSYTFINTTDSTITETVSLKVTAESGCSQTKSETIQIYRKPQVGFKLDKGAPYIGEKMQFQDTSRTFDGNIITYKWQQEGIDSVVRSGSLTTSFDSLATCTIKLCVQLENGCSDSTIKSFRIDSLPSFTLDTSMAPYLCNDDTLELSVNTEYFDIEWYNGSSKKEDEISKNIFVGEAGKYFAILKGIGTEYRTDTIEVQGISIAIQEISSSEGNPICEGKETLLETSHVENASFSWWYNDTINKAENALSIAVSDTGKYFYIAKIGGCTKQSKPFFLSKLTMPEIPTIEIDGYIKDSCMGNIITLSTEVSDTFSLNWYYNGKPLKENTSQISGILDEGEYLAVNKNDKCEAKSDAITIDYVQASLNPTIDTLIGKKCLMQCVNIEDAKEFRWYYNDILIPDANKYQLNAGNNTGTYRVAVRKETTECFSFSEPIVFTILDNETTEIEYNELAESLKLYPIPTDGNVTLKFNSDYTGTVSLQIYNTLGVEIFSNNIEKNSQILTYPFQLHNINSGIHIVKILYGNRQIHKKILFR